MKRKKEKKKLDRSGEGENERNIGEWVGKNMEGDGRKIKRNREGCRKEERSYFFIFNLFLFLFYFSSFF